MLERHRNWRIGWDQRKELRELKVPLEQRGLRADTAIKEEENREKDHENETCLFSQG